MHALAQHRHDIKLLTLQMYPFALQIVVYDFFLLFYSLRLARYLLQQHLHHVDLAKGQRVHLFPQLFGLAWDFWRF